MQWFPLSLCSSSTTLAPPASEPGPSLGTSAPPPTAPPFHREYNYTDGNVAPPIVCYQWHPSCLLTLYLTLTYILARLLVAVCVLLLFPFSRLFFLVCSGYYDPRLWFVCTLPCKRQQKVLFCFVHIYFRFLLHLFKYFSVCYLPIYFIFQA